MRPKKSFRKIECAYCNDADTVDHADNACKNGSFLKENVTSLFDTTSEFLGFEHKENIFIILKEKSNYFPLDYHNIFDFSDIKNLPLLEPL